MTRRVLTWLLIGSIIFAIVCPVIWTGWRWVRENLIPRGAAFLDYRDGVTFSGPKGLDYTIASWYASRTNTPGACPIVVHLPDEDWTEAKLKDFDGLRARGWSAFNASADEVELYSIGGLVRCWFRNKVLVHVEVNAVAAREGRVPPIRISVSGKSLMLPASETAIIEALGPPVRKSTLG